MVPFEPRDPDFAARMRASFVRQAAITMFGARLAEVAPGAVEIVLLFRAELAQQHGYLHGGVTTTIVDSACGYAALSLLPAGAEVLTVEYKVNFLDPAAGQVFVARGRVIKPGSTLTACAGDVLVRDADGRERSVATMLATMMAILPRDEVAAPRPGG